MIYHRTIRASEAKSFVQFYYGVNWMQVERGKPTAHASFALKLQKRDEYSYGTWSTLGLILRGTIL